MKNKRNSLLKVVFTFVMLFALTFGLAPSQAQAYGNTALYQVGISENCTSPTLCGGGQGGFWGWFEFDQGGLGDATVAGCGHLVGSGPLHVAGADSAAIEITGWTVRNFGTFLITSVTINFHGNSPIPPLPITPDHPFETGIPAQAGHYSSVQALGQNTPGVNFQIQVAQIPNR